MLDPITGVDLQPFHVVVMDTVAQAIEKRRQRIPVARARYDRVDHNGKRVACLQVSEPRIEPPIRGRLHVAQFAQGAQVNRQRGVTDTAVVEAVVDRRDRFGTDALVEQALLRHYPILDALRKPVEVSGVVRREMLKPQLRVFHRQETRGPGDPVQLALRRLVVALSIEQGLDDFRGRLTGAQHQHTLFACDIEVSRVVGGVHHLFREALCERMQARR